MLVRSGADRAARARLHLGGAGGGQRGAVAAVPAQGRRRRGRPGQSGAGGVRAAAVGPGRLNAVAGAEDSASLGEQLAAIIEALPEDHLTLGELLDVFGDEGLLLLTMLLTLVFLIPVSIPGGSTVFGGAIDRKSTRLNSSH